MPNKPNIRYCPNCDGGLFFKGFVERNDYAPIISIIPYRFKLALFDGGPHFSLPQHCLACSGCGSIWAKMQPKLFNDRVREWLKGVTIKETNSTQCKSCQSDNAISFYIDAGHYFHFENRGCWFWEKPGFWVSDPKIKRISSLCRDCGIVEYKIVLTTLLKKSKKMKIQPKPTNKQ